LEHVDRVSAGVEGRSPAERLILAELAAKVCNELGPARSVVEIAERALAGGRLLAEEGPDSQIVYMVINSLGMSGESSRATDLYGTVIADAAGRGSVIGFANASSVRSWFWYQRGAIAEAEADARGALVASADMPWLIGPLARTVLADVMIERGDPEAGYAALQFSGAAESLPDQIFGTFTLHVRARLAIIQSKFNDAIGDSLECGRRLTASRSDNPAMLGWRSTAATAYAGLGDRAEACRLAEEEVAMCRAFGSARPLGVALRIAGLIRGGHDGIALLGEAVSVLTESEAVLEHARALTDYGGSLRRAGQRSSALPPLRLGLDLAHRCGAEALAARARSELLTAGARPRRRVISGVDALTASERRIAEMAADGSANREIAQSLFVTERTVEGHLGNVYRKLEITSRAQLPSALGR
jgi:DNA-binding CsgD family transcriptional regulator